MKVKQNSTSKPWRYASSMANRHVGICWSPAPFPHRASGQAMLIYVNVFATLAATWRRRLTPTGYQPG